MSAFSKSESCARKEQAEKASSAFERSSNKPKQDSLPSEDDDLLARLEDPSLDAFFDLRSPTAVVDLWAHDALDLLELATLPTLDTNAAGDGTEETMTVLDDEPLSIEPTELPEDNAETLVQTIDLDDSIAAMGLLEDASLDGDLVEGDTLRSSDEIFKEIIDQWNDSIAGIGLLEDNSLDGTFFDRDESRLSFDNTLADTIDQWNDTSSIVVIGSDDDSVDGRVVDSDETHITFGETVAEAIDLRDDSSIGTIESYDDSFEGRFDEYYFIFEETLEETLNPWYGPASIATIGSDVGSLGSFVDSDTLRNSFDETSEETIDHGNDSSSTRILDRSQLRFAAGDEIAGLRWHAAVEQLFRVFQKRAPIMSSPRQEKEDFFQHAFTEFCAEPNFWSARVQQSFYELAHREETSPLRNAIGGLPVMAAVASVELLDEESLEQCAEDRETHFHSSEDE